MICRHVLRFAAAFAAAGAVSLRCEAGEAWFEGFENGASVQSVATSWVDDASDDGVQGIGRTWEFSGSNCLQYAYSVNNSPSGVFMDRAVHRFQADQDWSSFNTFKFHYKGLAENSRDEVYFELRDSFGGTLGRSTLPRDSTRNGAWNLATIDISNFRNSDNGTSLANVRAVVIGVNAGADYGSGVVFFDNMAVASGGAAGGVEP
jgi:hypothetical protein